MSTAAATTLTSFPLARHLARRGGRRTVRRPCVRASASEAFHPEVSRAVESLQAEFREVDRALALNSSRVSAAFRHARVAPHHFGGSTGYGHDDAGGREALDTVFAHVVSAEAAIVRPQFFSGTHAIACALFALLRPGHELLAVAGPPYDTLEEVIGIRGSANVGSLKDFGVTYREVPLAEDGGLDWDALACAIRPETGCALIQRSCGYSWRKSLSVADIRRAIDLIKMQNPNCKVMVDNCYGEFVETSEPPMVGADLIAGSLIKNPGGTIAPCGGYVAGKKDLVEAAAARLSAPGLGVEFGSAPLRKFCMQFQVTALYHPQGGLLIAEVMSAKGYRVQPLPRVPRHDIVQVASSSTLGVSKASPESRSSLPKQVTFSFPESKQPKRRSSFFTLLPQLCHHINRARLEILLLVLLAIGAATLSVSVLHKMRERRVFSILLQEREQQLMSLQALLENEKEISKEMRRKVDELEAKTSILSIERTELKNKVMNSETTTTYLTNTQKELEAALVEKENRINQMKEIVATSGPDQMVAIKELLQKKEAELEEIKTKFQDSKKPDTEVSSNAALGTNNENAASDTVALDNSASSGDTMPAPEINHNEETNVASTNNEDVYLDTVILEEKPNSSDSIPAPAELHSTNTTASESIHQDERILEGTNNEDITPDTVVVDEKASPSGSIPAQAEELQSYNTTASESNRQEDSSSEQFIKFTTNFEGDALQEKIGDANQEDSDPPPNDVLQEKRGDANQENSDPPPNDVIQEKRGDANQEDSDPPPKETHLEESEHHLADNQEVSKEELDGAKKLEDPKGEISNHISESELPEKEDSKEVDRESRKEVNPDGARKLEDPQGEISNHSSESELFEKEENKEVDESRKEVNPDGELKISKDSEANQEIMQVVEPVAVLADINPSMPTNNDETKETSRRHRKRKSRSKRRKRSEAAASNNSGEVVKER